MNAVTNQTPLIDSADIGRVAQNHINACAADLVDKIGATLCWKDRDLGFSEWLRLTEALNAAKATGEQA